MERYSCAKILSFLTRLDPRCICSCKGSQLFLKQGYIPDAFLNTVSPQFFFQFVIIIIPTRYQYGFKTCRKHSFTDSWEQNNLKKNFFFNLTRIKLNKERKVRGCITHVIIWFLYDKGYWHPWLIAPPPSSILIKTTIGTYGKFNGEVEN